MTDEWLEAMRATAPPPPPGYGTETEAPEWFMPDTFTGRREQLGRLHAVLWAMLRKGIRIVSPPGV